MCTIGYKGLKQPFTILCDGVNDNFEKKYFGIMVRFWDEKLRKVVTRFLDAPVCNIATGESRISRYTGSTSYTMEKSNSFCLG